ncbi:Death-associated protein kinase 1 [Symbiodinium microadriaticum]|uniref:Death-associated protein kinase 1 n=1 Tax=Symbiodinium microadriaticum TaxID=2951 RepID=A0A1Q9CMW3_SYMMI|nr:Death-associated protein kinase 1 [Symbiodinium microadriaticum]
MRVAGLVLLAALAYADASRVSTPGYLAGRQDRIAEIEKSLSSTAEQLARARNLFQSLREDEEAEAATTTTRGQPPAISLQDAAEQGDVAALAAHRQAGSDLNAEVESEGGWTAAHWAALRGQTAALKFLHEAGANLSATDRWGSTPVLMALEGGTVEMLEALVEAGVDLNVTDNGGNTPAILVADGLDHTAEKLLILLKAGADLEKANQRGRTPAHVLAERGEVDALRVLIQAGVNLNAPTPDGYTAADIAALNHHEEALKLLLKVPCRIRKRCRQTLSKKDRRRQIQSSPGRVPLLPVALQMDEGPLSRVRVGG